MDKRFSREMPIQVEVSLGKRVINYDIREATEEEILKEWQMNSFGNEGDVPTEDFIRSHKYTYCALNIPMGQWSYDGVINAIIRDKYRCDEMEAITNNMAAINAVFMQTLAKSDIVEAIKFLRESADAMDAETFREMQEWRAMAKKEAKGIFG